MLLLTIVYRTLFCFASVSLMHEPLLYSGFEMRTFGVRAVIDLFSDAKAVSASGQKPLLRSPRVWVNLRSRIYHCPGSKWYGVAKEGRWMTETEAKAKQYRAAYGRHCNA